MNFPEAICISGQPSIGTGPNIVFVLLKTVSWYDLPKWPLSSWLWFLAAMFGLTIVIWVIVRLVARVNEDTDPAEADREMLLALSELHHEGDLTPDEYRSIKSQLVGRLRATDERFRRIQNAAKSAGEKSGLTDVLEGSEVSESKIRKPRLDNSNFRSEELQSGDSADSDQKHAAEQQTFDDQPNDPNQQGS